MFFPFFKNCLFVLVIILNAQGALAQSKSPRDELSSIKLETENLLTENKNLHQQRNGQKKAIKHFKKMMAHEKKEIERIKALDYQASQDRLRKVQDEILLKKNQNIYLREQLQDIDATINLWKLQLKDLEYQQKEVGLNHISKHAE